MSAPKIKTVAKRSAVVGWQLGKTSGAEGPLGTRDGRWLCASTPKAIHVARLGIGGSSPRCPQILCAYNVFVFNRFITEDNTFARLVREDRTDFFQATIKTIHI